MRFAATRSLSGKKKIVHTIDTRDKCVLDFLADVHSRTGHYRYPEVSILMEAVLQAMYSNQMLKSEIGIGESNLRQLVKRRKRFVNFLSSTKP